MELAERLGVPPSRLDGREPAEVTEHEHAGGLLVRSVTTREPAWTEQDTALLLALADYRDTLCDCCGFPKAITQGQERLDGPRFAISKRWCLARRTLIETQQAYTRNGKDVKPVHGALRWSIRLEGR